jgi:hypothetical protein
MALTGLDILRSFTDSGKKQLVAMRRREETRRRHEFSPLPSQKTMERRKKNPLKYCIPIVSGS